jgi:protein kinase A
LFGWPCTGRDLKPENILIDAEGHIKLCDFGFSTPCNSDEDELKDGCGTAMYIAPEIASGFRKYSHGFGVDWWAAGCLLFEMLTGEAPFGDSDHMSKYEIFNNINEKPVRCPLLMNRHCKALINGLLEKKADKRFSWKNVKENLWLTEVLCA